jgi:protein-disulfide isomerase
MDKENDTPLTSEEELDETDELITFTLRRPTLLISILIPVAFALGLGIGYYAWGQDSPVQTAQQGAAQQPQGEPQRFDIPVEDNDPILGPEDAPVTIIEFSDYECPYCQRHNQQVAGRLQEEYGDQVRFVFKDFPLTSLHPNAEPAAAAALCAHEQGEFWPFHDKLFFVEAGFGDEAYVQYAEELDLDMDAFSECVEEGRYLEEVQADFEFAASLGVRSTPTFFVNGIPVVGAQSFDYFAQVIDEELAAAE